MTEEDDELLQDIEVDLAADVDPSEWHDWQTITVRVVPKEPS